MTKSAIIVAGGSGTRMGAALPKQFLEIGGKPVLMHTLERFVHFDPRIRLIVVLPVSQIDAWKSLCRAHHFELPHRVVSGGETRFHSVKNGLDALEPSDVVAIHDGVRPLVSEGTLERCFRMAETNGAAIPALPVIESLREGSPEQSHAVNRALYYSVQTPQVFQFGLLHTAYDQSWCPEFTDDASVVEALGHQIPMVEGNRENIKITHPVDLQIAGLLLAKE